jgi:hypothetical protein
MLRSSTVIGGLAVITAAITNRVDGQQKSSACGLLQVAELEAAIGGKVSTQPSGSSQDAGGVALDECSLVLSGADRSHVHPVSIRVVKDFPMDGGEAIHTRNAGTAREEQWKVKGARLEQATVGSAVCILAGRPNVASHTTCSVPRGKGYVEVEVIGDVEELIPMATVGKLAEKANSRL